MEKMIIYKCCILLILCLKYAHIARFAIISSAKYTSPKAKKQLHFLYMTANFESAQNFVYPISQHRKGNCAPSEFIRLSAKFSEIEWRDYL